MIVIVKTEKHEYVFPETDAIQIQPDNEELKMDASIENGAQIVRVGDWTDV